jgi:hypothetical protein
VSFGASFWTICASILGHAVCFSISNFCFPSHIFGLNQDPQSLAGDSLILSHF